MCLNPITIKNPYFGAGFREKAHDNVGQFSFPAGEYNKFHNTRDLYIQVPCGNCHQCVTNRQNFVNQRIQMESLRSHLFMLTLTYQDSELMHTNAGEYQVPYPYYRDVQNLCKIMRKNGYPFRYYFISEFSKKMRPHFHAIIAIERESDDPNDWLRESRLLEVRYGSAFLNYWRRNYGDNFNPIYSPLCKYVVGLDGRSTFDFHYLKPISGHDNDCSFYVTKYLFKYNKSLEKLMQKISIDPSLSDEQIAYLIHCLKPRSAMSKDFGSWKLASVQQHINSCLSHYRDLPQFSDLHTGKSSLLAPYYRKHLLPPEYKESLYNRLSTGKDVNSFNLPDDTTITEYSINSLMYHDKKLKENKVRDLLNRKY